MNNIFDRNISLEEPGHKYILKTDPAINFRSVTEIVSDYFEPFDKHAIAANLVATNIKYMGTESSELIAKWDAARDYGTKVHKEIEDLDVKPEMTARKMTINFMRKNNAFKVNRVILSRFIDLITAKTTT